MEEDQPSGHSKVGLGHAGRRVNLVALAQAQRGLILCILVRLAFEIASIGLGNVRTFNPVVLPIYVSLLILINIVTIVFIARMGRAYGLHMALAIIGAIAVVLPCIGLLLLVSLNQRVTRTIQASGAKVGFLGVNKQQMNKLREGVCASCGYNLRGITGHRCPECGFLP